MNMTIKAAPSNINLLHSLPRQKTHGYLRPFFFKILGGALIVILFFIYFVNWWLYSNAREQWRNLSSAQASALNRQTELRTESNALQAQLADARGKLLTLTEAQRQVKFTPCLIKLARYTPRGVWLEKININTRENIVVLNGKAANAALVTEFMQAIGQQKIFNDIKLSSVKVQQSDKTPAISFILSNVGNK